MVSVQLTKEIKAAGLTLSLIGLKFRNAIERSKDRKVTPPTREDFYQSFITQFKQHQTNEEFKDLKPLELYRLLDIHAPDNKTYTPFLLLLREEHKQLHAEQKKEQNIKQWEALREEGVWECKRCFKTKELKDFTKDNRSYLGVGQPCLACKNKRAKQLREVA